MNIKQLFSNAYLPIGLDFGTTKSAIMYDENGVIHMPTEVYVGSATIESGIDERVRPAAESAWKNFKLYFNDSSEEWKENYVNCHAPLDDITKLPSPLDLTAHILRKLKQDYSTANGFKGSELWDIGPVTITVPSFTTFLYRQKMIFAARVAGFTDICVIEEPVAAYLHHRKKQKNQQQEVCCLVIDFGGGTCDLALIEDDYQGTPVVLGTATAIRNRKLNIGGNKIDSQLLRSWMSTNYKLKIEEYHGKLYPSQPNNIFHPDFSEKLRNFVRSVKEWCNYDEILIGNLLDNPLKFQRTYPASVDLRPSGTYSGFNSDFVDLEFPQAPETGTAQFEAVMKEQISAIDAAIATLLKGGQQPNKVLLTGGSSYMRQVIDFVKRRFNLNKEDFWIDSPMFDVVNGAYEYQKERLSLFRRLSSAKKFSFNRPLKDVVKNRLSMSLYLKLGFNPKKDFNRLDWRFIEINRLKKEFIWHNENEEAYLELAKRGEFLEDVGGFLKSKTIPLPYGKQQKTWEIYQVPPEADGHDYLNIKKPTEQDPTGTKPIEILQPPSGGFLNSITFVYYIDGSGNFCRSIKPAISRVVAESTLDRHPDWDWTNEEKIEAYRMKIDISKGT